MRYVPSLPPPVGGVEERRGVQGLAAVKPAKAVQPRTVSPLVVQPPRATQEAVAQAVSQPEKRNPEQEPRRSYCRRVEHQPILIELRSGRERRKNRQRAGDTLDHIDEEA